MESQQLRFDPARLSRADRTLAGAGLLYFLNLFLPWNQVCDEGGCIGVNGWSGIGALNGVLVVVLLVWTAFTAAAPQPLAFPHQAVLWVTGFLLIFTAIRAAVTPKIYMGWLTGEFPLNRFGFLWAGVVLAGAVGVGGYFKMLELRSAHQEHA